MSDSGRNALVVKLKCQRCSRDLDMSYDKPKRLSGDSVYQKDDASISGAFKIENSITVYPCPCTMKAQQELDGLRRLLNPAVRGENK